MYTRRSTPTSTTTILKNHLKKHSNAYQEYIRLKTIKENVTKKRKTTDQVSESSNKSLQSFVKNAVTFDPSCKRAKEITKAIAIFIFKGLQPFSVVEEKGFKY